MKILSMLLLLGMSHFANAEWICETQTVVRYGEQYKACGVSANLTEWEAREAALNNALRMFDLVCKASTDCKDKKHSVSPGRADCNFSATPAEDQYGGKHSSFFKCMMLVTVDLY